MDLSTHFIDSFDQLDTDSQNIAFENITRHLVNWKNSQLFERIARYISNTIIEFKKEVSEREIHLTENLSTDQLECIIQMLDKELDTFDYYFNVEKLDYLCKITLEIRFNKFEYAYTYYGCKEGDGRDTFETTFYDNHQLSQQDCSMCKMIFCNDAIREVCHDWMYVYETIGY